MYIIGFKGNDTENRVKKLENSFLKQGKIDKEELFDGDIYIKVGYLPNDLFNLFNLNDIKSDITKEEIQNIMPNMIKKYNIKIFNIFDFDDDGDINHIIPLIIHDKLINKITLFEFVYDNKERYININNRIIDIINDKIGYKFIHNRDYHFIELINEKIEITEKWMKNNTISFYHYNKWKDYHIDLYFDMVLI